MRKMKDSGVDWIGEIPADWNVIRMKNAISKRDGGSWGVESQGNENDYVCIRIADFDYERMTIKQANDYEFTRRNYDSSIVKRLILEKGDILIEKSGGGEKTPVGRTIIFNENYSCMYANFIDRLRVAENIIPKYMQYILVTFYKNEYVRKYIKQTTGIQNLDITTMLSQEEISCPSLEAQQRIADYLDEKCAKIDAIIARQQEVIEKLKTYKSSVIMEAVTKGLNSDVPMKDSGIEWIGFMPEHWKLIAFKYILNERREINLPVQTEERLSLSIDKGVTLYAEKTTNLDRFKDNVAQYKLAHEGDLVLNSMNMIVGAVGISRYFGCVSPAYYTYYDTDDYHIAARYCEYLFKTKTMRKVLYSLGKGIMSIDRGDDRVNTCRLKVSRNDLRSLKLPMPSHEEQNSIVNFLDKKNEQIDASINVKSNLIEKLVEYKKSLIYEVVTGKKEV
ncbi:MAG: hypothetical protein GX660_03245 [Clostridiaceae bacterium]|nr:hypothetical protein [Clostridiaceae bacterium]